MSTIGINLVSIFVRSSKVPQKELPLRSNKTGPRATAAYMVGYVALNIWKVWTPKGKQILHVRNNKLNECLTYDPDKPFLSIYVSEWQLHV